MKIEVNQLLKDMQRNVDYAFIKGQLMRVKSEISFLTGLRDRDGIEGEELSTVKIRLDRLKKLKYDLEKELR